MKTLLSRKNKLEEKEMRDVYCQTLIEMAKNNEDIVVLDADLMNSMHIIPFLEKYPERTFNCGVQEANMMGVAAGLSMTGKIPFVHSFGPFATRRAYDQVFMSGAYARANVRIFGSDPGITAAYNGGTHMPFEDLGIMRNIPEMTIIIPTDTVMLKNIIKMLEKPYGMFYVRLLRKNPVKIYREGSEFALGKAKKLRDGDDITLIANGIMVNETLQAAELLDQKGISARVIDMFTLKPLDIDTVLEAAEETKGIVTVENHNIINGLGSAVAEILSENYPVPLKRVGVNDEFGEVGPVDYLKKRYKLTKNNIVKKVEKLLERISGE